MSNAIDNAGRCIVVTGGANGIGAAVASRLTRDGAHVISLDIARSAPDSVEDVPCDLSSPEAIDAAVENLPQSLDALVHVAGVAPALVDDTKVMAINFLGLRHLNERLAPRLRAGGRIVIVASSIGRDWRDNIDAVEALLGTPDFAAGIQWLGETNVEWRASSYKFSKQCAAAYTQRAAAAGHPQSVNVNCVNPGIVETQLSPWFRDLVGEARYEHIVREVRRAGTPDDIAGVIAFLLGPDAAWVNGVEILVDGGFRAGVDGGWLTDLA